MPDRTRAIRIGRMLPGVTLCASALLASAAADRSAARAVLRTAGCDSCHDSAVSAANAKALAIYDLHDDDWPRTLADAQLPKLLGRLRKAPPADRQTVQKFIDGELRARRAKVD
jgi:hypothetical protein